MQQPVKQNARPAKQMVKPSTRWYLALARTWPAFALRKVNSSKELREIQIIQEVVVLLLFALYLITLMIRVLSPPILQILNAPNVCRMVRPLTLQRLGCVLTSPQFVKIRYSLDRCLTVIILVPVLLQQYALSSITLTTEDSPTQQLGRPSV